MFWPPTAYLLSVFFSAAGKKFAFNEEVNKPKCFFNLCCFPLLWNLSMLIFFIVLCLATSTASFSSIHLFGNEVQCELPCFS